MCCSPGLSLDHQTVSAVSRVRLSEREEESMSCFLRACDAALSYMQELDKVNLALALVGSTGLTRDWTQSVARISVNVTEVAFLEGQFRG